MPTTDVRPDSGAPAVPSAELSLPIAGMACASCANRIERYLRRTDGVVGASVNLATERAQPRRARRAQAAVEAAARPGQTQRVQFRIEVPDRYMFDCTVPGHAEHGMEGVLIVDPAA